MAMLGKSIRMSRLVNPKSDKMMAITVDHSISRGIMTGLIDIQSTIDKIVAGGPNAITMMKGIAEKCFAKHAGNRVSLLLKCSSYSPVSPTCDTVFGDAEEAIRFGADGASIGMMVLGKYQGEQMAAIGKLSKECSSLGLPLVAHIYPKGESVAPEDRTKWENIAYAVRTGAELGVDIIKTTYTGDWKTMAKVVETCPARVAIQGGDACKTIEDYMQMTYDAINKANVGGVVFGRFVWSYKNVTSLVKSLSSIIHDKATPAQAMTMLHDLESDSLKQK